MPRPTPCVPCSGPLDRRTWLKIGGLSFGALAAGVQPNLARLLAAEQAARQRGDSRIDRDFSVILFWANGGPSHIDMFDLKPEAPTEYRGPFRPIATNVPGMEITELLPRLARLGDKFTLLRSLCHERAEHSGGTHRFLTGYSSRQANLQDSEFPEIGSIVARHLEHAGQGHSAVCRAIRSSTAAGRPTWAPSYAPFMPSPNPITSSGNNSYDPVPIYKDTSAADNLDGQPQRRAGPAASARSARRSRPAAARARSRGHDASDGRFQSPRVGNALQQPDAGGI